MSKRLDAIIKHIESIDYVKIIKPLEEIENTIKGEVHLTVDGVSLPFSLEIYMQYPRQVHDIETIRFINKDLLPFNHVNYDGSICIHTLHSPDLQRKLELDFYSLKEWIVRYYINKEKDLHYEHIVVPQQSYEGRKLSFLFTEVDHTFRHGQSGSITFSPFASSSYENIETITYIIQDFKIGKKNAECIWSGSYKAMKRHLGLFYYSEQPPVVHGRFAIENWIDLEPHVNQTFLMLLHETIRSLKAKKNPPIVLPLLFGYKISETEIHWQTILVPVNDPPSYGYHNKELNRWEGKFHDQKIIWAATDNCSPKYFFGRGALHEKFTQSKILIIGIGAIGSMVATTLTRGGAKDITLIDYDIKSPGNVCRSEYTFISGIVRKDVELTNNLIAISPFVNVATNNKAIELAKLLFDQSEGKDALTNYFSEYDIVIDCTTDNDVAYLLDQLDIQSEVLSFSITNHANELVCATKPNLYNWTMEIFDRLNNDTQDLYNPTGCWSPTFKASYNDIATLVQYAIKHINMCMTNEIKVRNFYLGTSLGDGFNIKLNQF